eukprot:5199998-Amphidinium_carterae.2
MSCTLDWVLLVCGSGDKGKWQRASRAVGINIMFIDPGQCVSPDMFQVLPPLCVIATAAALAWIPNLVCECQATDIDDCGVPT